MSKDPLNKNPLSKSPLSKSPLSKSPPSKSPPSKSQGDWSDDLMDRGLAETVGGEHPPDLRGAIRARLRADGLLDAEPSGRGQRSRAAVWAALAAVAIVALTLWLRGDRSPAQTHEAVAVPVQVIAGELHRTRVDRAEDEVWRTPQIRSLALHDTLRTGPASATLRVEAMGTLTFRPQTRIEVRQMTLTRTQDRLVVATVAVVVTSGAVGWASGLFERTAEIGETVRLERKDLLPEGMTRTDVAALQREVDQLRAQMQQRVDRSEQPEPEPAEAESVAAPTEEPTETAVAALFDDPEMAEALASIDWATAGASIEAMMPIMEKLRAAMAEGGDPPLELVGELQKLNGDLVTLASKLVAAEVPGAGVNGSFTHPSVVANTLGHTLQAAGLGLSEDQSARMESVLKHYRAEDKGLRDPSMQPEFALEGVIEEGAMKDRMFDEMSALLSPEQLAAVRPGEVGGRTSLDMFSTGVVWSQFARPIGAENASEYASKVSQHLGGNLKLDTAQAEQLRKIVERTAGSMPTETWNGTPDPLAQSNFLELSSVRDAARRHVAMLREIAQSLDLTEAQMRTLRDSQLVPVPVLR